MVTRHFGHDPFWPEKRWTFRPKKVDISAKKDGLFGQNIIFNSFTKSGNISRGNRSMAPFPILEVSG